MESTTAITRNCAIAAGWRGMMQTFALICAAGHSGSVAGPWCCRSRRPHARRPRGAADVPRCRPVPTFPCRLPSAPGRSLGRKRCRPVVLPVKIGPTLPARGAADVPRCRPVADVLPVVLPAGQLRPVAPRSRPVTREALPARGAARSRSAPRSRPRGAADVLALPAGCRRAARGAALPVNSRPVAPRSRPSLGKRCRPVVLPGQDRPHAPAPLVLPTCCAAGRLPTCCPWCCRPVNSRPVAPRSRPVTRGALPAPWCCRSRSPHAPGPWCCRRAALPAGCRRAARCAGRPCQQSRPVAPRSRPVTREALPARVLPSRSAPRSRPVVLPTSRSRPVADVLPVVLPTCRAYRLCRS